jgi:hypothetical protein
MVTAAPAAAKARAAASPMPVLPPTMITCCPSKDRSSPRFAGIDRLGKFTETSRLAKVFGCPL